MATTRIIPLKLVVDKSKNQVVFAESGKDFVDVLLSFLTLPMATIIRLTDKDTSIVSMENLYKSIESLDTKGLLTSASKSMLIKPRNAAAQNCKSLVINIDDTLSRFYICPSECGNKMLSTVLKTRCICGEIMNKEVHLKALSNAPCNDNDVFVKGMGRFMISDDGVISPVSTEGIITLLEKLEIKQKNILEEREVDVSYATVLLLLKKYFRSKMLFTDVFLADRNDQHIPLPLMPKIKAENSGSKPADERIELLVNKQEKKVLYAEVKENFVNLLLSFLTFAVGSVVKLLGGSTNLSIDNLYRSAESLSSLGYFKDSQTKEIVLNPMLMPYFQLLNNPIQIYGQKCTERYYMCQNCTSLDLSTIPNVECQCNAITNRRLRLADPKHETNGGFLKSAIYMVADDLVVTRLSSFSVICDRLNIAEEDTVEVVSVDVGEMEALALLRASLTSSTVLTDAFASRLE